MGAAIIGCATTTHLLFKTNAIATSSPLFLFSRRHHHRISAAASRLVNSQSNRVLISSLTTTPSPIFAPDNYHTVSAYGRRRRMLLPCFCTEAQSNGNIATMEGENDNNSEDSKLKEAANSLDLRVGKILKAWRHEEADSLYVEEVDVGEPEPRTICSGLVNYIPIHLLQDRNVIILANLKPRNMRGVKSFGMLMAASDASHEKVELLVPPEGAMPGDRVWFGSLEDKESLPDAASPNQIQKKKIWELVQPHLKTDETCVAALSSHPMRTSAGPIISESLKNANIS